MATEADELTLSEESPHVNCTFCSKKSRIKQAASYCSDCTKYLCVDCVEIHIEHIADHKLVDVHDVDKLDNMLTEKCGKHKDQVIELFCVDHDQLTCSHCATLKHRSCHVEQITELPEELNNNPNVQHVSEQLQTALQHMDQAINALDKHTEELSQSESKYLQEIEEYTKRLLARIEDLKSYARKGVTTKHQQLASQAEKNRHACITCKTYINKCLEDMKLSNSRKAHLFILKKKGQKLTRNVETLLKDTEHLIKSTRFVYQTNTRIEQYLSDTTYLGRIEDKCQASLKVSISASIKGDSTSCNIQGCCLLADGTVLLTDDNNKRVIRVNTSECTIKDHCDLSGYIRGITCIGPHEVAVGIITSAHVISLGNNVTCKSTIQLNHDCYRIFQSDGELFTSDLTCVYVHDLTGTLLRTICKNASGKDMFSNIRGIVLNQTGDRVYVADYYNGLICTDRAGQEVFRLTEEELGLSRAHGVCTDQRGNVLVCGYGSNNVVQVTEEGRVIGEILSRPDGIERPRCLCYDADKYMLYVGGETSNLLVYQLV